MTAKKALERFAAAAGMAYFTRRRIDGTDKAESEWDEDYKAFVVFKKMTTGSRKTPQAAPAKKGSTP